MNLTNTKYIVALYMRLSKDDGDKEESESIINQRKILRAYVKENGYEIYDEYIDDGYSGTNFDRPNFKRMIKDIEDKKVNMVITKTLARLGRDYIETGRLIEKYFPENQIRYIALLDDVDSLLDSSTDMVALKNLMNDFYAKETSKNVRKTKHKKRNEGTYYIGYPPYGYNKIDKEGHLEVNNEQASIVKRIYKNYIEGYGTYQIAKMLTKEGIPTPGLAIGMTTTLNNKSETTKIWDSTQVRRILLNPIYIGNIVQNKVRKVSYKSKKRIKLPEEDYIIHEKHHEAIISEEDWELVQKMYNNKKGNKTGKHDELLKSFLYCRHCNNKLSIVTYTRHNKHSTKLTSYIRCSTAYNLKAKKKCFPQYATYSKVEKIVVDKIIDILKQYIELGCYNNQNVIDQIINSEDGIKELICRIEKNNKDIEQIDKKIKMLYTDRLNGMIEEQDYIFFSNEMKKQRNELMELKQSLKQEYDGYQDKNKIEKIESETQEIILKILKEKRLTKMDLYYLIKRIEIDKDKNIYINFKFHELNCIGVINDNKEKSA